MSLFATCIVLLCAVGQGQDSQSTSHRAARPEIPKVPLARPREKYEGQDYDYWKPRTQIPFALSDRRKAIEAVGWLVNSRRMNCDTPSHVEEWNHWLAAEIVPMMTGLLQDKDAEVRASAANVFRCHIHEVGKGAIPVLTGLLQDQDQEVRQRAAEALGTMGREAESSISALVKLFWAEAPALRMGAPYRSYVAEVLVAIGPEGVKALSPMLDDDRAVIRFVAVKAVHEDSSRERPLLSKLIQLFRDENADVRTVAAWTVASMKPSPKEALPEFVRLLHDKDCRVRANAIDGLTAMEQTTKQGLPELIQLVDNEDNSFNRLKLARGLGGMGPEAIPALARLLEDKEPNVRSLAADSLGRIGPAAKDTAPALKRLLTDMHRAPGEYQGHVCNHAGEALVKILGDRKCLEGLPPMPKDDQDGK